MREDCRAEYACGHVELDSTSLNVGESSYCNVCKQPQVIVARMSAVHPMEEEIQRLRKQVAIKDEALEKACQWLDRFGEHAPITMGGESELWETLRQALNC